MTTTLASELFLGQSTDGQTASLNPAMANRHGLIAGATGTGKTFTLKRLIEEFSRMGTPVFVVDVKGDVSGLAKPGTEHPRITERLALLGNPPFAFTGFPVTFWDVYGDAGHPLRTTVSEMGPLLLSRLLDLNPTQESVLTLAFQIADDQGLLLLDLKDLQSLINYLSEHGKEYASQYGSMAPATLGAIQRAVMTLNTQGGDRFFGEPALNLNDWMTPVGSPGNWQGPVHILMADKLMLQPKLYATLLLWLLSELYEDLPEVGDVAQPRLALFFDEAHLMFDGMPDVLLDKITQVVRLIRSKGVGVFFITQNPLDIPDTVRGQLGNRIQHALRVFSPKDEKVVRTLADSFPGNPDLPDMEKEITCLGIGEALISTLDEKGQPTQTRKIRVAPARSFNGALTAEERSAILAASPLGARYAESIDRESACELLAKRAETAATQAEATKAETPGKPAGRRSSDRSSQDPMQAMMKSAMHAIGAQVGREIMRGIFGSMRKR
ncbi:MAG: helicase HerA-like domain-containing protein [Candidatus Melainabacteria bacterium]